MKKDRTCQHCNKVFENIEGRSFSNHVRWCEKNPKSPINNKIYCSFCEEYFDSTFFKFHKCKENKICKFCNKQFKTRNKNAEFCNSSCAASFNNKFREYKKGIKFAKIQVVCKTCGNIFKIPKNHNYKGIEYECDDCLIRNSKLQIKNNRRIYLKKSICIICKNEFNTSKTSPTKTCSKKCAKKLRSKLSRKNKNCGGETNYKKYLYKEIYMDSSWEVEIAQLMDDLSITWVRDRKYMFYWEDIDKKKRRYYPDFYLPQYDIYLDPKNKYLMKKDEFKLQSVKYINNISLYAGDIKYIKSILLNLCFPN